ncbi:hypothetical protein FOZ60_014401 [Perkinsus olseni]|uniref:Uncharacterized protein n=1 Tax=Perkinsus olseni TaxID=32597 RepID=A0A7J6P6Z3_PEROL|nr:hypothetical protein FOZ60_014401 [Perkinsus olseni]
MAWSCWNLRLMAGNTACHHPVEVLSSGNFMSVDSPHLRSRALRAEYAAKLQANKKNSRAGGLACESVGCNVRVWVVTFGPLDLHRDPADRGAVFQVASQFNCLEMPDMNLTPEDGITNYITDPTQGPACAMECAPGTLYRNYFVDVNADGTLNEGGGDDSFEPGQRADRQLDCLAYVGKALHNDKENYWHLKNGGQLAVGVQWDTEVSSVDSGEQRVCQVYCAAVPVAYAPGTTTDQWEPFARLVLRGCYESTLLVAALRAIERGAREKVFLTLVGGGVFGNDEQWIVDAIWESITSLESKFNRCLPIDIIIVHHSRVRPAFEGLARRAADRPAAT